MAHNILNQTFITSYFQTIIDTFRSRIDPQGMQLDSAAELTEDQVTLDITNAYISIPSRFTSNLDLDIQWKPIIKSFAIKDVQLHMKLEKLQEQLEQLTRLSQQNQEIPDHYVMKTKHMLDEEAKLRAISALMMDDMAGKSRKITETQNQIVEHRNNLLKCCFDSLKSLERHYGVLEDMQKATIIRHHQKEINDMVASISIPIEISWRAKMEKDKKKKEEKNLKMKEMKIKQDTIVQLTQKQLDNLLLKNTKQKASSENTKKQSKQGFQKGGSVKQEEKVKSKSKPKSKPQKQGKRKSKGKGRAN